MSHKTNENKKWELKRLLQHLSIYVNKDDNDSKGIVISKEQYKKIIRRLKEEAKELNEMGITIEKKHNEYYIVCDAHKLQNALETK